MYIFYGLWLPLPLDSYLSGHLKAMLYQITIRNINHLEELIANTITSITSADLYSSTVGSVLKCVFETVVIMSSTLSK